MMPAQTAAEHIANWDAGDVIWSVEMGGLGPGYEQALQVMAVEITRDNLGVTIPLDSEPEEVRQEWWGKFGEDTLERTNKSLGGLSGAQFGAAKQLAHCWLTIGPAETLKKAKDDRHIQVSRTWPRVEP
jgi:hypothetical protein